MDHLSDVSELLTLQPMPKLAEALGKRAERILQRWDKLVHAMLPDADPLTSKEVRNSIPKVIKQMSLALAADNPLPTEKLMLVTRDHGYVRFHESYNIQELIEEYRLMRRIICEEIDSELGGNVTAREWTALGMCVDIALQQAVVSFVQHQNAQLTAATQAEAKFLSFLAHDLRNDLNHILLTMEWVESTIRPSPTFSEQADGLRDTRDAVMKTIAGMERLLHAERLRKGVRLKNQKVGVYTVAQDVAHSLKATADAKGLMFENLIPRDATVQTDAELLTVVLQNLIGNAVKYCDRGRITLSAKSQTDTAGGVGWVVDVTDQGPGIAPNMIGGLFNAFSRGETHGQGGVGLGLYIASQGARALGGILTVDSVLGQGTTFHLHLPTNPEIDSPDAVPQ